jgi:hypothetical protein
MPQPTRFWRFSYDSDESLAEMLENGSLIAPSVGPRSEKYDQIHRRAPPIGGLSRSDIKAAPTGLGGG